MAASVLSTSCLAELCRALRHSLGAGLALPDVFRKQAERGPAPLRPVARQIADELERGSSLEAALQQQSASFPPLFLTLAAVGEQSGHLPELFGELEKYFRNQQELRRRFLSQIAGPGLQFIAAVCIIAFLLWALGFIAQMHHSRPIDPLGLGLTGGSGALIFLLLVFASLAGLAGLYFLAQRSLRRKEQVDVLLLRLPVIGPCVRALVLMRFCLSLGLTTDSGMPIAEALRLSLRATGNGAFQGCVKPVQASLKSGDDLTLALSQTRLFPEEFLHLLAVAEESGQVPEVMRRQAKEYEEEAGRRLTVLTTVAARGVWLVVAALIVVAIFRIYLTVYLGPLQQIR
jgi:type IV pilus assembly protein PilC